MPSFAAISTAILAVASTASAAMLHTHNWGNAPIYYWAGNDVSVLHTIPAGAVDSYTYVPGASVSLKFSTGSNPGAMYDNQIMQFEYKIDTNFWYDLSMINGDPFKNVNVKVTPTGAGAGSGNCITLRCPANQVCSAPMAYEQPNDIATHACPVNTGDTWLDIGEPTPQFNTRSMAFTA